MEDSLDVIEKQVYDLCSVSSFFESRMVILPRESLTVFKGTDRAVFLDKREFTGSIYTQIFVIFMNMQMPVKIR